ncbi:uncharacterized protein MELLADRAFT_113439 [Melampsora larici-populina 98AG31]|uniref:F-box domain-containing protein n=1 Tax=Melampsora larici-populina (strain 98AG31 / pathotype 3-4-7) TaxID=747676 RepID=F4S9V9_MELLP|nr:uncharacterized protein MELLADRAFT_113439 [Melampsora larici-populina 98AG31]EGF98587.1 hypothetical protein MELLADRAFT_113439 [Melampsora larici-populina 98AG31]
MFYMAIAAFKPTNATNSGEERFLVIRTTIHLQRLRLISRNWARVVPYFLFDSIRLQTRGMAHRLLDTWQGSILSSADSPLRYLSIEDLFGYSPADPEIHIPDSVMIQCALSIPMYTGAKIIHTFGINITSLSLIFGNCMMVSDDMIEAVKYIKCLDKLTLIRRYDWPRQLSTDSNSIAELLSVVPTLESLSVSLPYLEPHFLLDGSLPCLRHFWFEYFASSRYALSQIVRAASRTLNTIEYESEDPVTNRPAGILGESQFNLECRLFRSSALNEGNVVNLRGNVVKYDEASATWEVKLTTLLDIGNGVSHGAQEATSTPKPPATWPAGAPRRLQKNQETSSGVICPVQNTSIVQSCN